MIKEQKLKVARNLEYRRNLRNQQTVEEEILWNELRNNKLGVKIRRQHSIVEYVVDFYCPKYKLAIEIDGSTHKGREGYDNLRTEYIKSLGIKTIRFWGGQIRNDLNSVLEIIRLNLTL